MTPVPLTAPQIELLLTLARVHRDELESYLRSRFLKLSTGGRVPTPGDAREAEALELTVATIKVLEEAK